MKTFASLAALAWSSLLFVGCAAQTASPTEASAPEHVGKTAQKMDNTGGTVECDPDTDTDCVEDPDTTGGGGPVGGSSGGGTSPTPPSNASCHTRCHTAYLSCVSSCSIGDITSRGPCIAACSQEGTSCERSCGSPY
jgi:hypothetical protein